MNPDSFQLPENDFIQRFVQNAAHVMWFLGAGTSRSAGLPSANDIIWDLKRHYYCLQENQDIHSHDINNRAIKGKIQSYMNTHGFPKLGSPEEYSFYFDLMFKDDAQAQQKYICDVLAKDKISLTIGHRVLAALMAIDQSKVVFTTNFDEVIETAYSAVTGKNISCFHLEGSYAALDALNAERFPLYAKVHGDFRYRNIKNLTEDLRHNDEEIQKCFLASATRFGLIVSGYSGRDDNVLSMFREAVQQNNAFSNGLFWTVPKVSDVDQRVFEFIKFANENDVYARLIETGTFDEMLSKIWRQIDKKFPELNKKVRTAQKANVSIPLPSPGTNYPILRTNALPIISMPSYCGAFHSEINGYRDLRDKIEELRPNAVLTYTDKVLFWGNQDEAIKVLHQTDEIPVIERYELGESVDRGPHATFLMSFYEKALTKALCQGKPLFIRTNRRSHYAVVRNDSINDPSLAPLREALAYQGRPGYITGSVPGIHDTYWAESVSIKLEERGGKIWLMLQPDIWIRPLEKRRETIDFMRKKRLSRYNNRSFAILDAWIKILLGEFRRGESIKVSCFENTDYSAEFMIGTRTAYSRGGQ